MTSHPENPMSQTQSQNRGVSKQLRFKVLSRDAYACRYCGAKAPDVKLHVDHVIPFSIGGSTTIENLATACEDCNLGKGANAPSTILPVPVIEPLPVAFRPVKRRAVPEISDDIPALREPNVSSEARQLPRHPLIGFAFLSFHADGEPDWQGEIADVRTIGDTLFVEVDLYSWVDGQKAGAERIPVTDFLSRTHDGRTFRLFATSEERSAFYVARFEQPQRQEREEERARRAAERQRREADHG